MAIEFDAEDKKLKDIFGDQKYLIPRYQRPYSWTNSEVEDLWNDVSREDLIFLGSFVFSHENYDKTGFVEVIDGQQRLITLTIFFAVLRDIYRNGIAHEFFPRGGVFRSEILPETPVFKDKNEKIVLNTNILAEDFLKSLSVFGSKLDDSKYKRRMSQLQNSIKEKRNKIKGVINLPKKDISISCSSSDVAGSEPSFPPEEG